MSTTPLRCTPPSPYERSSLGRLPVEVSRILIGKNFTIAYVFVPSLKVANLRDPIIRVIKTLPIRLQIPLRCIQTISTLLSRSVHPRATRSSHDPIPQMERIHHSTRIPDMHPGDCGGVVPTTWISQVRKVQDW